MKDKDGFTGDNDGGIWSIRVLLPSLLNEKTMYSCQKQTKTAQRNKKHYISEGKKKKKSKYPVPRKQTKIMI